MKKLTFACLPLFCITTLALGQGLPMAVPEEVGISAERLERIRPVMQGYVDDGRIAGFLTAVARRGKIVHFETIGMRDVENNKPIEADTIFRIHSMSKPITSVAVMMLYEEGHFQLDTPVSDFIPEFKDLKVYNAAQTEISDAKNAVTVKHLLTHTAGLIYGWGGETADKRFREANIFASGTTLADMARKLSTVPLVHEPGEDWTYGVSTDVLGYLVEVVSGMPFEEFLQTRLFKPLGMVDTAFSVPLEKLDRFAALYQLNKEGEMKGDKDTEKKTDGAIKKEKRIKGDKDRKMRLERVEKDPPLKNGEVRFFPGGGGGLVSTAPDYMRFCQMLLNGGELEGVRILKKETVELMHSPHHDSWFGLGFAIVTDKKESADDKEPSDTPESTGSYSWGGAAGTIFWIDPEKELIGLLMTQIGDPGSSHDQFKILTYQALIE
ncbi:beta-lactamase family protein [Candidatus Poribacteria bacterium]|nr:beta-lactamase family protein [Candidatus Poribacteria bacterium]MYG05080.1 beta-lactamase family protein [Candidatus Poribacteria bacterium]MYK23480.1 beta-lactamase family protein [Candidatus Poribacteria bacterium]